MTELIQLSDAFKAYEVFADTSAIIGTFPSKGPSSPRSFSSTHATRIEQCLINGLVQLLDRGSKFYVTPDVLRAELMALPNEIPADRLAEERGLPRYDVEGVYRARRELERRIIERDLVMDEQRITSQGGPGYGIVKQALKVALNSPGISERDADVLAAATIFANCRGRAAVLTNDKGIFEYWRLLVHARPFMRSRLACFKRATEDSCEPWYLFGGGFSC